MKKVTHSMYIFLFVGFLALGSYSAAAMDEHSEQQNNATISNYSQVGNMLVPLYKESDEIGALREEIYKDALKKTEPIYWYKFWKNLKLWKNNDKKLVLPPLSPSKKIEVLTDMLRHVGSYYSSEEVSHEVTFQVASELSIDHTQFKQIDSAKTMSGRLVLSSMLTDSSVPSELISNRDNFIRELSNQESILKKLKDELEYISKYEAVILNMLGSEEAFQGNIDAKVGTSKSLISNFFWTNLGEVWPVLGVSALFSQVFFSGINLSNILAVQHNGLLLEREVRLLNILVPLEIIKGILLYMSCDNYAWRPERVRRELVRIIHRYTISVNQLLRSLRAAQSLMAEVRGSRDTLKYYKSIARLINKAEKENDSLSKSISVMKDNPKRFSGEGSYWTIKTSSVLQVYRLLQESRDSFSEIFEAIGEIDAFVGEASRVENKGEE